MTYINSVRATAKDAFLVSGGDFLFAMKDYTQGTTLSRKQSKEKAKLIIDCYNRFGYKASAVGECDLAQGMDVLRELEKLMEFPLLSCNLVSKDDESLLFKPSTIVNVNGHKVGVVGAILDTLSPTFLSKVAPGTKILPPVEAVRQEVEKLRDQVDVMLILGHVNRADVEEIAKIDGVDFILEPNSWGGNTVIWINENKYFEDREGTVLLKTDGQGAAVGRIDLYLDGKGKAWTQEEGQDGKNRYAGLHVQLGPHWGHHSGVKKLMDRFKRSTRHVADARVKIEFTPSEDYLTVETCQACHPDQYAFWKKTGHAKAYATLEKTGDEFRYDCLPCHVVGYGEAFIDAHEPGPHKDVQCEACHGTNPRHPTDPARFQWPKVDDKKCWGCHNPMETKAYFNPAEAIPKIACPKMKKP